MKTKDKCSVFGLIFMMLAFGLFFIGCDMFNEKSWTPTRRALSPPWNTYLIGENRVDTSGSVYGSGSSTYTFDGTNVFTKSSYQHWQGGSKHSSSTWYITRIELHQESWESYPVWRIFYKLESSFWHSESDFNNDSELNMRVPTILNGKYLKDYVEIPGS